VPAGLGVGRRADRLVDRGLAVAAAAHHVQEGLQLQCFTWRQLELQARIGKQSAPAAFTLDMLQLVERGRAGRVQPQRAGVGLVGSVALEDRGAQVVAQRVGLAVVLPVGAGLGLLTVDARTQAELMRLALEVAAHDDVDGAGDGARAVLGHRRAHDLDALDLVGRDRVEREARRHALAVDQDLGVAAAHAAHAHLPAAPRRAAQRDTG